VGAPAPPGRRKIFRRNSQGKLVTFYHILLCVEDLELDLVLLDRLLEATTKKGRQFFKEKSAF